MVVDSPLRSVKSITMVSWPDLHCWAYVASCGGGLNFNQKVVCYFYIICAYVAPMGMSGHASHCCSSQSSFIAGKIIGDGRPCHRPCPEAYIASCRYYENMEEVSWSLSMWLCPCPMANMYVVFIYGILLWRSGGHPRTVVTAHIVFEVPRTPLTNNLRGDIPCRPLSFWFGDQCHLRGEHYCWGLASLTCESYWILYNFVFSHLAKMPWLFLIVSLLILMRVSVFEAHYDLTFAIMKITFFSNCVHRMSLVCSHGPRCQYNFNWLCQSFLLTLVPMPLTLSHETLLLCICMDEIMVGTFALFTNTFF